MSNTAYEITERLLNALDKNYNVIDMGAISDIISDLENIEITKELLETTRLGKHVNELRRRTSDATLARRAKMLVKRWRDLVIPDRSGPVVKSQSTSGSQAHSLQQTPSGSVDNTPHHSPMGSRGISPAVTPRLSSPHVFTQAQKQGSLTPSGPGVKPSVLAQHIQQQQRRQPLTSPGHRNVPQLAKNTTVPFSPGLRAIASPLVSPVVSNHCRNTSPALKNLSPGLPQRFSPGNNKNISPGSNRNVAPNVNSVNKHSPSGIVNRNLSPGVVNPHKILSPGMPSHKNISPGVKNTLSSQPTSKINSAVKNLSPALRLPVESAVKMSSSCGKNYDSDSQDVIWVDDDEDVYKTVPVNPLTGNDRSNDGSRHSSSSNKRPRSPVNGEQWRFDGGEEYSHKESKKAKKEPRGRKPKKRRNHKSENRTVDHSLDPVPSPFLPAISSSSTSPVFKNGVSTSSIPIPSPASSVPVLVDDVDSRSPKPEPPVVKQRSSRKNGCKKNLGMDDYSAFIKNKIHSAGKKVKTTMELYEEIQSRKQNTSHVDVEENSSKPKEDFLTLYDNKKKEMSIITDVIELNDSNSSLKQEDVSQSKKVSVKEETKEKEENEPIKFEPVETILARLPPVDRSWMYKEEDSLTPPCTCTLIYSTPEVEVKMPSPLNQPKKSIFEMDYEKPKDEKEELSSVVVPALPLYEENIDPHCEAALVHEVKPSNVSNSQILALHNCFIPDVNGTTCDKKLQFGSKKKPICKMDYWGSKPLYDCENKLFYSVVPKYNYLDYSLDRCVKNLTKVRFNKYEPVEATPDTKEWLDEMERNTLREIADKQLKTETFNSPADSPFSEAGEQSRSPSHKVESSDTVIQDSVNLDRDLAISNSVAYDDYSQSSAPTNNNDPSFHKMIVKKEYQMDCDDLDSVGSESCKPWTASTAVDQIKLESSAQDQTNDNYSNIDVYKCPSSKGYVKRQLNYSDSVTLLPLNLKALNAAVGYPTESSDNVSDLSSIFRTNFDTDDGESLTYSVVADPVLVQDFDHLKKEGVMERLRRNGSIDQTMAIDLDEDAISDADIKPTITDTINVNNVDNYGALNPDLDKCVSNGCPEWLDKLSRDESFREWHEPVVRTSYNDEPLTVLPYIVID